MGIVTKGLMRSDVVDMFYKRLNVPDDKSGELIWDKLSKGEEYLLPESITELFGAVKISMVVDGRACQIYFHDKDGVVYRNVNFHGRTGDIPTYKNLPEEFMKYFNMDELIVPNEGFVHNAIYNYCGDVRFKVANDPSTWRYT